MSKARIKAIGGRKTFHANNKVECKDGRGGRGIQMRK
jgi:hypothetical protein